MKKTIEELEKELEDLKASHRSQSDIYGSELCAGDMIRQEEKLEKQIRKLKAEKLTILKGYEENQDESIGLKQLRETREETIARWKKSGLLDGISVGVPENLAALFESQTSFVINELNENNYNNNTNTMEDQKKFTKDEFRNNSGLIFKDITDEQYREYVFPDGVIRVDEPIFVNVSASGGHRVFAADGKSHYIPKGWIDLRWEAKEDRPHFAF